MKKKKNYFLSSKPILDVINNSKDTAKHNFTEQNILKDYFYKSSKIYECLESQQIIIYFEINQIQALSPYTDFIYNFKGVRYQNDIFIKDIDIREFNLKKANQMLKNENINENNPLSLIYFKLYSDYGNEFYNLLHDITIGYEYYINDSFNRMKEPLKINIHNLNFIQFLNYIIQ